MPKKLIITEKPSVARDFARVLNVKGNGQGFIENDEYVISWCFGHLVEMVYPEEYDIKYKRWNLEDLPFLPEKYKYGVINSSKDQYKIVNSLLHREDIDVVYWAGDSGKEGQTIEENIRNYGGVRDGMRELRVWIDSQTDDEIKRGINEAKPMSDYFRLGKSGIMRTIEDYALGINFSRALSVKYGKLINDAAATKSYTAIAVGRVMTCVLGMVVDREREIRNFTETPFYRVCGNFSEGKLEAEWHAVPGSKYDNSPLLYKENGFKKKESAEELISFLSGKNAHIEKLEKGNSKKKAPLLFNLAELQSECSKIFKISPAETLAVIQELYEKKLTTYPRTDARVLTTAVAKEIGKNLYGLKNYAPVKSFVENIISKNFYRGIEKTHYTDDSKVTDHYAIIPTGFTGSLDSLPDKHKRIYDLIVRRFLSIFYPAAEFATAKAVIDISGEKFQMSCKVLTNPGYMEISGIPKSSDENNDSDENISKKEILDILNRLSEGDSIDVSEFVIKEGKTAPPKRYTSGNLILAMENAGNLIEDEELREQIKNTGIGTSATRGEILEKLVRIGYLNQNNKTQIITPEKLGEMIYEVVFLSVPSLLNPEMTASWEKGLEGIINGSVDDVDYRRKLEDYIRRETNKMIGNDLTNSIAANINQFTGKESKGIATIKPLGINCPVCGGELNKTSFGYGCSNYRNESIKCRFGMGQIAGIDINEEDFKDLIVKGKTRVISGFTGKNKSKFSASILLYKDENGRYTTRFDFSENVNEPVEGVQCPACGGSIVKTGYGYACENRFKEAESEKCYFGIGEIAGKKISENDLLSLLNNGETGIINGFKTKKNTPFAAKIKLSKNEDGRFVTVFDFEGVETQKLEGVKCPDCGGPIEIKQTGFGCGNYSPDDPESCRFFIGKIAGKKLSASNVKELLNNGRTSTIRDFKSKNGNKFDAVLILKKNEAGKSEVSFDFENVESKVVDNVLCPACGGRIIVTKFGYSCENHFREENKCYFTIGEIAGKKLSESDVKDLLTDKKTKTIRGFKGKNKKAFDAVLVLKPNEDKFDIAFDFENVEAKEIKDVKCPVCGGKIVVTPFGYGCANYNKDDPENSCKFSIGQVAGKKLSESNIKELLSVGETDVITGFKSKKGSRFDAKLALSRDENGKVTGIKFVFDDTEELLPDIKCPKCGGNIIRLRNGFKCENFKKPEEAGENPSEGEINNDLSPGPKNENLNPEENGCDFYVSKIAGVSISEEQLNKLLKTGKTDIINEFLSKKGLYFDARLKLNDEKNIVFDFEGV
ncbi:MAG: topoisomerase C-terminal repeat-containing protein [Acetatifactor sp.]|nr:topoisomerase C-terminal repeat-containing protein [Acetatifactor sp.]